MNSTRVLLLLEVIYLSFYRQLKCFDGVARINALNNLYNDRSDNRSAHISIVLSNIHIVDHLLLTKEALKIKQNKPTLNNGLIASKELHPFFFSIYPFFI